MPLRIVFMGTAELACPSLLALKEAPGFEVAAVVTQPDRPGGRHLRLQPSPVKQAALDNGIPVLQPLRARDEGFITQLRDLEPELIVVAAYGQILPPAILELPRHGCLNIHTSLLPKYRGAAPIQTALLNGDPETGVTIMKMDAGLDTGDMLRKETVFIEQEDDAQSLHDKLAGVGAQLIVPTVEDYIHGKIVSQPQPAEGVSHAPKIRKQDGLLDWTQPAAQLWNRIRAFTPRPGAFTHLPPAGTRLKVWKAEVVSQSGPPGRILGCDRSGLTVGCGRDALRITRLQLEGGRALDMQEFIAGHAVAAGQSLR